MNLFYHALVIGSLLEVPLAAMAQSRRSNTPVLPASVALELLVDVGVLTEGPAADFDRGVYFVDLDIAKGGRIWRWDPASRKVRVIHAPSGVAAGLALGPNGDLFTAELASGGGRRVGRFNPSSRSTSTFLDAYQGKPIHGANDLVFDEAGRLYFTEYALLGPDDVLHRQGSGVYRVDPGGTATQLIADAGVPNGIAISPDQATLYVGSNMFDALGGKAILAYDLSPEGNVGFRAVLVRYPASQLPNGMAVDVNGNLYVAIFSGRVGVAVYDPEGTEIGFIPAPGPATNVEFGRGVDDHVLYVTAATGLYRLHVNRRGCHPAWPRRSR